MTSARLPVFLFANDFVTVPMTVRNDGLETWYPDRGFLLSYHWLRTDGEIVELDGLRTELPEIVPAGQTTVLDARLAAPERAGLYLLQWDLVEEHVLWFSSVDPLLPTRTLLVVAPGVGAGFSIWPALGVIAAAWLGLRAARRRAWRIEPRWVVALGLADVAWCMLSLWTKQWVVLSEAGMAPDASHASVAWTTAAAAGVLLVLVPGRVRPWAAWGTAAFGALVVLADLVYFRFFGDVISTPALLGAGQAGQLTAEIASLFQWSDLWLAADLAAALPLMATLVRTPRLDQAERWTRLAAPIVLGLTMVPGVMAIETLRAGDGRAFARVFRNLYVVRDLGVFGYHVFDAGLYFQGSILRTALTDEELEEVRQWFAGRAPQRAGVGPAFGAARGRNLIVVQVEAMQDFVIGYRVDGREVTPNLNRRMADAVRFTRVVDQTSEGRTSDAELIGMASLLPLEHGAAVFRLQGNHFVGFPEVLARHGYHTASAIAFDADFWNRRVMHPQFGFERSLFVDDFPAGEHVGWGLNDDDFLGEMARVIRGLPRPFCLWAITMSLHHPYGYFPHHLKALDVGRWEGRPFGNYLHAMHLFDRAFERFLDALDGAGVLDDSVIVVVGDHDAGFPDEPRLARALGFEHNRLEWRLADRVPLAIWVPGPDGPRGERSILAGQVDLAPTLLALVGIDPAPLPYVGRNLLGEPGGGPIVMPYGDWVDESHLLIGAGSSPDDQACYDVVRRRQVDTARCLATDEHAARMYRLSQRVLDFDLQRRIAETVVGE